MSKAIVLAVVGLAALCIAHPRQFCHTRARSNVRKTRATVFAEFRQLKCATPDGQLRAGADAAHCHMIIKDLEAEEPGRPAPEGDGCFKVRIETKERAIERARLLSGGRQRRRARLLRSRLPQGAHRLQCAHRSRSSRLLQFLRKQKNLRDNKTSNKQ